MFLRHILHGLIFVSLQLFALSAQALPSFNHESKIIENNISAFKEGNFLERSALQQLFLKLFPEYNVAVNSQCLELSSIETSTSLIFFSSSQRPDLKIIELQIVASQDSNAISFNQDEHNPSTIVISQAIIDLASSDEERGFIIAHEMAHLRQSYFLPDLTGAILTSSQLKLFQNIYQDWEHNADIEAIATLATAGLSASKGAKIIDKASATGQTSIVSLFHHPVADLRQDASSGN